MFGLMAAVGQASTMVFYVDIFNSSYTDGTFTQGGSAAMTSLQLQNAALGDKPGGNYTNLPSGGTNQGISLPKFDTTIGGGYGSILTSVQIIADWALQATLTAQNNDPSATHLLYAGDAYADMTVTGPNSLSVATVHGSLQSGTATNAVIPAATAGSPLHDATYDNNAPGCAANHPGGVLIATLCIYNGPQTNGSSSFPGGVVTTGEVDSSILITGLGAFEGAGVGSVNLSFNTPGVGVSCNMESQVSCGATGAGGGVVEIIYNYAAIPTPEPVTIGLVGGALLGLAFLRRRKAA
jgi:hypothetical protein